MGFDPISYSAVVKLKKDLEKEVDTELLKATDVQTNIILPASTTSAIGSSTNRFSEAYIIDVYIGDLKLDNNWIITERDNNGNIIKNGIRILNDKKEEIFKITEDGIYFKGKKLKLVFE